MAAPAYTPPPQELPPAPIVQLASIAESLASIAESLATIDKSMATIAERIGQDER